jgi:hypothetical protein
MLPAMDRWHTIVDLHPVARRLRHRGVRWVAEHAPSLTGFRTVEQPAALRHFTARFEAIA